LRSFGLHLVSLVDVEQPAKRLGVFVECSANELSALEDLLQERCGKTVALANPEIPTCFCSGNNSLEP
jgi:hypothetical protein